MKVLLTLFSILFFLPNLALAQPTFAENVAEIVYNKCATCHRQGEIGPFLLTNYDEVSSYAQTIKAVTASKYMPPWKADPTYQNYLGEYYLTEGEIQTISDWVDAGAPRGDIGLEPDFPIFPDESSIGEPDLVLEFEVAHLHKGNNRDEYRYFVLPTGLLEDKKVKAIELRPGNARIVHHALFFQDLTGEAASFDAKTPEYGFEGTAGFDDDVVLFADQYPAYAPGQRPRYFPDGMAQTLNAGSDLIIQMHYAPFPTDELDKSTVNIFFADEDEVIDREVKDELMLPTHLQGGFNNFFIPANQTKEFIGTWNINKDVSLIGVFPHMHLLGRNWEVWLERPDGTTENLIKINDWDFNWQGTYYFNRFIVAPKGSKVKAKAKYDNTTQNPFNPNNPPKFVTWGENTTDEMYYIPIVYVDYKDGDENVIFDQMTGIDNVEFSSNGNIQVFPNPSSGSLINVAFELPSRSPITAQLFDINGKLIRTFKNGEHFPKGQNIMHINPNTLSNGVYTITISGINYSSSEQVIIKQ